MGTPWESMSVATMFRFCRSRRAMILGSSVLPSAPQFQDMLLSLPSRLSSLLASLRFSL